MRPGAARGAFAVDEAAARSMVARSTEVRLCAIGVDDAIDARVGARIARGKTRAAVGIRHAIDALRVGDVTTNGAAVPRPAVGVARTAALVRAGPARGPVRTRRAVCGSVAAARARGEVAFAAGARTGALLIVGAPAKVTRRADGAALGHHRKRPLLYAIGVDQALDALSRLPFTALGTAVAEAPGGPRSARRATGTGDARASPHTPGVARSAGAAARIRGSPRSLRIPRPRSSVRGLERFLRASTRGDVHEKDGKHSCNGSAVVDRNKVGHRSIG